MTILEELARYGTVLAMEKEDGDYATITDWPIMTQIILEQFEVKFEKQYDRKSMKWTFDFNIYHKGESIE